MHTWGGARLEQQAASWAQRFCSGGGAACLGNADAVATVELRQVVGLRLNSDLRTQGRVRGSGGGMRVRCIGGGQAAHGNEDAAAAV